MLPCFEFCLTVRADAGRCGDTLMRSDARGLLPNVHYGVSSESGALHVCSFTRARISGVAPAAGLWQRVGVRGGQWYLFARWPLMNGSRLLLGVVATFRRSLFQAEVVNQ